jgi:hypothetical protein
MLRKVDMLVLELGHSGEMAMVVGGDKLRRAPFAKFKPSLELEHQPSISETRVGPRSHDRDKTSVAIRL